MLNLNLSLPSSNQYRFKVCGYYTEKSDFHREDDSRSSAIISSVTFSHEDFKTLKRSQNDHDRNVSGKEYKTGCIQTFAHKL